MVVTRNAITIAGAGPGSPDYITPLVARAVHDADVLAGAPRLLGLFRESSAERIVVGSDLEPALAAIAYAHAQNRRVTVLVTGDPGVASLAQPIMRRFGRDECRLLPGVSSVQVAFARLGLSWDDAIILNAHRATPSVRPDAVLGPRTASRTIAVLLGCAQAANWLEAMGRAVAAAASHRIIACRDLTLPHESIAELPPEALANLATSRQTILLFVPNRSDDARNAV